MVFSIYSRCAERDASGVPYLQDAAALWSIPRFAVFATAVHFVSDAINLMIYQAKHANSPDVGIVGGGAFSDWLIWGTLLLIFVWSLFRWNLFGYRNPW